jgi:hypothetical protein
MQVPYASSYTTHFVCAIPVAAVGSVCFAASMFAFSAHVMYMIRNNCAC